MIGAIIGDIVGSVYEAANIKTTNFPLFSPNSRFTDDTVLTIATAHCILDGGSYNDYYRDYYRLYPHAGYGGRFILWAQSEKSRPYNSWGNGSAMRISPVGFAFDTLEEVVKESTRSAEVTHNHPDGIKGAQAIASAVFLSRTGAGKEEIHRFIAENFGYNMDVPLEDVREYYTFDVSCSGSVPQAIRAFLESDDFEDAVRKAVSIGGDSDTIAAMAGSIAQAYYREIPQVIENKAMTYLDERLTDIVIRFREQYRC